MTANLFRFELRAAQADREGYYVIYRVTSVVDHRIPEEKS